MRSPCRAARLGARSTLLRLALSLVAFLAVLPQLSEAATPAT
jgi:hypothetical protein